MLRTDFPPLPSRGSLRPRELREARKKAQPLESGRCLAYALATLEANGARRYFFVSHAELERGASPAELIRTHAHFLYGLQPDLEQYAAARVAAGARRGLVKLCPCDAAELEHVERFEIVRLLREGHPLKNREYLAAEARAQLDSVVADASITSAPALASAELHRRAERRRQERRAARPRDRVIALRQLWKAWINPRRSWKLPLLRFRLTFPVLWRRLERRGKRGELELPLQDLEPHAALGQLIEQARAG